MLAKVPGKYLVILWARPRNKISYMTNKILSALTSILLVLPAFAQTTPVNPFPIPVGNLRPQMGVTTLVIGTVPSSTPSFERIAAQSNVRVPFREQVRLLAPEGLTTFQWVKNGEPIAGATNSTLVLPAAVGSDAGVYSVAGSSGPIMPTGINLDVAMPGNLGNFSNRVELAPGGTIQSGFVITGNNGKNMLLRAVGPTLKSFGVANPVARPRLQLFNQSGQEITFGTIPAELLEMDAFFKSVGAFPLLPGEHDVFLYAAFMSGNYTMTVSDETGRGGTLLLEAYEFTNFPTVKE
jgi:hypothetical protein